MVAAVTATFVAEPPSGAVAGVLVLHAWWGLTDDTRDYAARLASDGLLAHAPDMFGGNTAVDIPVRRAPADSRTM